MLTSFRATAVRIFSAAIILAVEARFHEAHDEYLEDIAFCVEFLNNVKDSSIIATRAIEILRIQTIGLGTNTI